MLNFGEVKKPQCPNHGDTMKMELKEVRTGYMQVLRKVMKIWICTIKDCNKWCEETLEGYIWP